MPPLRSSQGAEAARAAVAQAEFNEKKWVWVPDDNDGYLAGWVVKEQDDVGEVVMAAGGDIVRLPLSALSKMNPPKFDRVDDIADLTFLNEASVVHNLRLRYGSGSIYTYSGLFLVAINPYQNLPLYSDAIIHQYRGKRKDENPPHIFAIAERAWINMGEERENQSILITGESGAGKTESTKKVISYLAAIATDAHLPASPSDSQSPSSSFTSSVPTTGLPRSDSFRHSRLGSVGASSGIYLNSKGRLGLLERQILQANPILEAFGNAQTQRNNNSSRFGKFIRISFSPDGSIAGANVDWYLLEKSRVVVRSEAERSFHVFYQLMEAGGALKDSLLLAGGVEDYEYLNKSRREVDGIDDHEEWVALKNALDTVGFTAVEQFDLFRVVAAILHLGNIVVSSTRSDDAVLEDPSQSERVCHLLGIPVSAFTKALLRPKVLAGKEWVTQARTRQQALDELSALCKTLYEKSFGSMVERINRALDRPSSKSTFIGVLDIAGFEIFDRNGYEQLLINFTNEKLQQFFNHHMFVLEQEEYARESIEWNYVNFGLDLQPTIDLIEASGNAIGILSCLDEECIMPKATDLTFTNKLHSLWASEIPSDQDPHPGRTKYAPTRFEQGFIVQHYAGRVEYRTEGWLEKNKDPLNDNLTRVLANSSEKYIASLFSEFGDVPSPAATNIGSGILSGRKRVIKKGAFRTAGQRHKEQLASLMAQLMSTQPHFVRCIVPNPNKKPGRVDIPLVLDQLRCNGVLEGIRIARLGYPNRLPFVEFRQRYEVLTPGIIPPGYMDGRKACLRMVDALDLDKAVYKIGTSKIFFKAGVLAELEERRDALLFDLFSRFQAMARMWTARRQIKKILNRAIAIRTIQRNAKVYGELREWPWWQLYTKVRPLLAATRNDEELRKKEMELALAKEKAERDKQEKDALESLKMELENEKRKIEEDLGAERALGLDKDALLERSKKRESELEEDVLALQVDLDTLDSQLDRALQLQRQSEEQHETLKLAFDQAAEHLVRLETEQQDWAAREGELSRELAAAQERMSLLQHDKNELEKLSEELTNLVHEREEDVVRMKDRTDLAMKELEGKLTAEMQTRELLRGKSDNLEQDSRHAKEQLAEMARTATEYSNIIKRKEEELDRIKTDLETSKRERARLQKHVTELEADLETLSVELDASRNDRERDMNAQAKVQNELDQLRVLLEAKTSEETRRSEVEKRKEEEIITLRTHVNKLQAEISDARSAALEAQNKLKVELDTSTQEHKSLQQAHESLLQHENSTSSKLNDVQVAFAEAEKTKRALESELQSLRSRQFDTDTQLADATRAKENLERQLSIAQTKCLDYEDAAIQLERDKANYDRHLESIREQLRIESNKSADLERLISSWKQEIITLKDRNVKLDRDLNKTLTDVKNLEWQNKQLESKQDKTIVEHVHVLEEAKRVTDRQLSDAQIELQKSAAYIRSLEKAKARLTGEAEDFARQTEQERLEIRAKEKAFRSQEQKVLQALAEVEKEHRSREAGEIHIKRLQADLVHAQQQATEANQQMMSIQRSKDNLETELARLADSTDTNSVAKIQRQYETRIAQLESQIDETELSKITASKIKDYVDRQHGEIRRLIMSSGPKDESFRSRLLKELQLADEEMEREFTALSRSRGTTDLRTLANITPLKRSSYANGTPRSRRDSRPEFPRPSDKQVDVLKQQLQVLELKMAASDRIRQHLESSLRELTSELDSSDGSNKSLEKYRTRLSRENGRLAELLRDEVEARRAAEAAQVGGDQELWDKFQRTISGERESHARLEESRKALVVQQRATQLELDDQRRQVQELAQSKKQLEAQVIDLNDRLELEVISKTEESSAKRQLQLQLQDLEVSSTASSTVHSELQEAAEMYKTKADSYLEKLEGAEISRVKSARAEAFARRALADVTKARDEVAVEVKALEERLKVSEERVRDLEARLEDEGHESANSEVVRQRLAEIMDDERKQHRQDLSEREFTTDQTRKKYQAELAQLSEELQSQRDNMSRLREEKRKLSSDYDELQLRYDDEVYNGGAWKKEKERLDTKIVDLTKAYESATGAQMEQQAQIVSLHSQVRELRGVLNDAEADRTLLQKARRALQAELDGLKLDGVDSTRSSSATEVQKLHLAKQDLERTLEEHVDRATMASERMKKAEAFASECQMELGKIRVENSELDKLNATLDNQVKELNVRIVDLETRSLSYASSSRSSNVVKRLEGRIQELTNQLNQTSKDSSRLNRTADKSTREAMVQLAESDRQRTRLEEELKSYESRVQTMRQTMDEMQTNESNLQLAKRRVEREAADYKQKTLGLQRELERLRNRLERPPSATSSPRKQYDS